MLGGREIGPGKVRLAMNALLVKRGVG